MTVIIYLPILILQIYNLIILLMQNTVRSQKALLDKQAIPTN